MASITLATLRTRARQRANMENSTFVSDAEFTTYVNASAQELYDLIIQKFGESYYESTLTFTLTSSRFYSLPADFYKLVGVNYRYSDDLKVPVKRFSNQDYVNGNFYYRSDVRYKLKANEIEFTSTQGVSGKEIELAYIPLMTILVADGDTLSGFNGWEEYIVIKAAIKALMKEESDWSGLGAELAQIEQRIESVADNRDANEPFQIIDSERQGAFPYEGL